MTFIQTVSDDEATGVAAELLERARERYGFVPNWVRLFAGRPDVHDAWEQLLQAIRDRMDRRRYELATVAAARRLRSSYCMLAHSSVLIDMDFYEPEAVRAIASDHRAAGLDPVDVAVMDLAERVAADATSITQEDVDRARAAGLSDPEIFEVVLAASLRAFFTKTLDALGVEPDASYRELDPELQEALVVGRPIAEDRFT
jgi:uncharacterized peroxidase-related enzyme